MSDTSLTIDTALVVAVDGAHGLASQLLARVLADAGATVVERGTRSPDVVVLVEPTAEHWDRARETDAAVVLLSDPIPNGPSLLYAVEHGARGALSSRCEGIDLVQAVRRVASGDSALSRSQTRDLCDELGKRPRPPDFEPVHLTNREIQILQAIDAGESRKQTARSLGISPRTVENTQRVLFRKLGVRNRAQAVARAYALGTIDLSSQERR